MIFTDRKNIYENSTKGESCISKIKSFKSNSPKIFYGIIAGFIILVAVVIIILCVVLTKKDKDEETPEIKETKIFPLEASSKQEVMNIYNSIGNNDKGSYQNFINFMAEKGSNLKDEQKVYLAYYWIINNIDYDYEGLQKGTASANPSNFFTSKKSICSGYSELFKDLLLAMNYPSDKVKNIIGYAKGLGYTPFKEPTVNHEWNAVEINGKWCLIDTTWDANVDTEYYLCTPPKCFVRDHLPEYDDSLQFLDKPLTLDKFHALIDNSKAFCRYDVEAIEDKAIQNMCGEGKFILKYNYESEDNSEMHFLVLPNDEKTPEYFIYRYENRFEVLLSINEQGVYDIHLSMNGYGMGEITFNCDKEPTTKKYYPTLSFLYSYSDTQLLSPIQRDLIQGQRYNFELTSTDYEAIKIKMDDEEILMTKTDNKFKEDNVYIHSDSIKIYGENNDLLVTFKGTGTAVDFPKIYSIISRFKIRLIQPSTGTLKKGNTYEFIIRNDSDGEPYIYLDTRIEMEKSGNIYKKTLEIESSTTATKLQIGYKNLEPLYTTTLYEYTLE